MTSQASPVRGGSVQFQRIPPGTNPSNTPATTKREPIITINGKQFRVTQIQMKINGAWQDVDLAQFNLSKLAKRCQRIFEDTDLSIPDDLSKLTFYFEKNDTSESFISRTLGKVSVLFKAQEKVGLELTKLEVQPKGSDQSQIIKLDEVLSKKEADLVKHHVGKIDKHTSQALNNPRFITNSKKRKRDSDPITKIIDTSIQDAGSAGNRCAALSLAKKELDKANSDPQEIVGRYELPAQIATDLMVANLNREQKITILANAFIAKAAAEIKKASPNPFIEAEIADSRNPLQLQPSAAIRFALEEYQKDLAKRNIPYAIAATLAQRAKDYAALMNTDNFMLDLPFFLALRQPFLIIEKIANSYYTIIAISDNFRINGKIDAFKIDDVNVVSYNGGQEGQIGNHYQPLILDTDIHKNAMRQVIVNTINGHINNFIQGIKEPGAPSTKKQRRNADNYIKAIRIYPAAKDDIIEKLKLDYPAKAPALDLLKASPDNNFAPALHDCIHSHS